MNSGQWPLDPVSEAHSVFSNRDLHSTSGGQPTARRAIAIDFNALRVSWTTLTKNSIESHASVGIYNVRWSCDLGGSIVSPDEKTSVKLYM